MINIIPALDIIDGKCVRLEKGDYMRQTRYETDPLAWARSYEEAGCRRLHLVDLDGARTGEVKNLAVLEKIASRTDLTVDFGGGVQSDASLQAVWNSRASLVTVGSIAVKDPGLLAGWLQEYGPGRFILGADVKDRKIMISGWMQSSGAGLFDFIRDWMKQGISQVLCTDIDRDGMLGGSALELYRELVDAFPGLRLIASGGIAGVEEIGQLDEMGVDGVVLGKSLLEGKISLAALASFLRNQKK